MNNEEKSHLTSNQAQQRLLIDQNKNNLIMRSLN